MAELLRLQLKCTTSRHHTTNMRVRTNTISTHRTMATIMAAMATTMGMGNKTTAINSLRTTTVEVMEVARLITMALSKDNIKKAVVVEEDQSQDAEAIRMVTDHTMASKVAMASLVALLSRKEDDPRPQKDRHLQIQVSTSAAHRNAVV